MFFYVTQADHVIQFLELYDSRKLTMNLTSLVFYNKHKLYFQTKKKYIKTAQLSLQFTILFQHMHLNIFLLEIRQ